MFIGEEPIHIKVSSKEDIAELVLMPGDPLRAKYIAEKFLENARMVTSVRNMLGFTGTYKGKKITVMGSGMGMPSMSIYAFELFHFFNVKEIIRIGTCGAVSEEAKVSEILLSDSVYSESNFVREHPGGVTLTQLHQELGLAKATLSQVVKTLREKGYLRAAVCREDERQRLLTPTEKLRKLRPELERAVRRADQALRQLETQDERKDTT